MKLSRRCASLLTMLLVTTPAATLHAQASASTPPAAQELFPAGETTALGQKIVMLLASPEISSAHWGIAVTALDGTPLYGLNQAQLFRPASNAKLFTTSAAMAMLGPQHTFETKIYGNLSANGTITGDLTLRGDGDASFGTDDLPYREPQMQNEPPSASEQTNSLADLNTMIDQLVARGVKRVKGNIVGDDSEFVWLPYPEGWSTEDLAWSYGAPPSALDFADNKMRLTVIPTATSGPRSSRAITTLDQNGTNFYQLEPWVETGPFGHNAAIQVDHLPGTSTVRVYGDIPSGSAPVVEHIAVDQPALYAADTLQSLLAARGITVKGHATAWHQPQVDGSGFLDQVAQHDDCTSAIAAGRSCGVSCISSVPTGTPLATHVSPPLIEDIVYLLKESQNLHAETLLDDLGRIGTCRSSEADGVFRERTWLTHIGIDPHDFMFYDGSGLSTKDLVTPRATAELLAYDAKQPWFAQWKAALPVGGVDGTLEHRFTDPSLKGRVFAKTGTLGETAALSGYVLAQSGQTVIFSIFADTHLPGDPAVRETIDRIVAAIAASN